MPTTNRFLIVQLADIGDLVLSTPALAALREAHPGAHVAVLTTAHAAPILNQTGLADEVITFDKHTFDHPKSLLKPANLRRALALAARLRRGKYDTIIFLHHFTTRFGALKFAALAFSAGSGRRIGLDNGNGFFLTERLPDEDFGARHQAQYWLDLAALLGAHPTPRPAVVGADTGYASRIFSPSPFTGRGQGGGVRVALHPGSGGYSLARRWDANKFAAVADALHEEYGAEIVLVGGAHDDTAAVKAAMRHAPLDLSGKTDLNQLAGVLKTCDLFIGADSGVMHVAAAAGTPVVAIFGPSNPNAWRPWTPGGRAIVVSSAPECAPCSYVGHGIGLRDGCAARTCMRMVTPERVLQAARALIINESPDVAFQSPSFFMGEGEKQRFSRLRILGLPVDPVTYDEWLALIDEWISSPPSVWGRGRGWGEYAPPLHSDGKAKRAKPQSEQSEDRVVGEGTRAHHVCTINPEFIMIARRDPNFFNILNRADLCVPDGVGLLWAAKYLGALLPERVTGSDGVPKIAERAAQKGWRLFLLGAAPGVADRAAAVLRARYPGVQIVGAYSGSKAWQEEDALVERVNASGADILFVAFGAPEQDKWIARNLPRLRVTMAMGVGGAFDFIAGVAPRAPLWMRRLGLEWLFRLYLQPWRIRRMLRLPHFVLAVLLKGKRG